MKKRVSVIMSLVLMLSTIFSVNVFAKTNLPSISKSAPLTTYTYNSSGKVYAYTASNLKTKTGGYIACSTDECKIIEISGNAVKVTYPVSNGTKTAWFSREAFTYRDLANDAAVSSFTAQAKATTYKWKGKSNTFGSIAINDKCYLLRGNENSEWVQIIYPVSKGHKMGWVKGSDYAAISGKETTSQKSSTSNQTMTNALYKLDISTSKISCGFDGYVNTSGRHEGIDFNYKNGASIYSLTDGVITRVATGKNGSNGLSTIAIYDSSHDKTVVYLHSAPLSSLYVGQKIKKGDKIGTESWRGCSNSDGGHTHVEVRDGEKTHAAISVGDSKLDNSNPTSFWKSWGYTVK